MTPMTMTQMTTTTTTTTPTATTAAMPTPGLSLDSAAWRPETGPEAG